MGRHQTVEDGQDNLRFIFARSALSGGGDAESVSIDGLEVGRFAPTGNFGIGNFYTNGLNEQPTQRLDVDGTARLRQVPQSTPANNPHVLITGRMQDVNPTNGDYVLNHLGFSGNSNTVLNGVGDWVNVSGGLCDWTITGQNLSTGHAGSCLSGNVGVGRFASANVRLDALVGVPNAIGSNNDISAIRGINNADGSVNNGILAVAAQLTQSESVEVNRGGYFIAANAKTNGQNIGVYSIANDYGAWEICNRSFGLLTYSAKANNVYGVYSNAQSGSNSNVGVVGAAYNPQNTAMNAGVTGSGYGTGNLENFGIKGFAQGGLTNYGVYGDAIGNTSYAIYANGNSVYTGGSFWVSDESIKTDIQDYNVGLETVLQLTPKSYQFLSEDNPSINLSQDPQIGLIAQEVDEVLPHIVQPIKVPARIDTLGNVLNPSMEILGVNYVSLIPILVSAVKEQQTIIENQNDALAQMMDQLAAMQQQINDCCNSGDGNRSMPGGVIQPQDFNNQKSVEGGNELFQNIPNPFRESTTISYQLEEGGRVQLSIYDNNGKVITTLTDANQGPGRYSEVWNANGMPSGVYHYALYVNGELLVKRAIKLQE